MSSDMMLIAEYVIGRANACEVQRKKLGPTGTGTTEEKLTRYELAAQHIAYVDVLRFIINLPGWNQPTLKEQGNG